MTNELNPCGECGMPVTVSEYHPYAACLMFKACGSSTTVVANLKAVKDHFTRPSGIWVPEAPKAGDIITKAEIESLALEIWRGSSYRVRQWSNLTYEQKEFLRKRVLKALQGKDG